MILNKKTVHSATGQHMITIIKTLLSITDPDIFDKCPSLKSDIDKLIKLDKNKDAILDIL